MTDQSLSTDQAIASYEYDSVDEETTIEFDRVELDDERGKGIIEEYNEAISDEHKNENFRKDGLSGICPTVGMEFDSVDEAYNFYNQYAGKVGFSVRKYSTSKSHRTNEINGRSYCCSRQGARDSRCKPIEECLRKSKQTNLRTGCKAMMCIRKRKEDKWVISRIVEEHNHKLAGVNERHKLRSIKRIASDQRDMLQKMQQAGLRSDLMTTFMNLEGRGSSISSGVIGGEVRKFLSIKQQRELIEGDIEAILHYFECQQIENPAFFHSIQVDSEGQMTNFFWTDARARIDYHYFGDVVYLGSSYGISICGLPFVPILGINHHSQAVLFGAALLYTESEESLEWVIKTWMMSMNGKQPKVILTDQDSTVEEVIKRVLPGTHHKYSVCHISECFTKKLPQIIHANKNFCHDFNNCLHNYETIEEFECNWLAMIKMYNIENDSWLMELFEKREKWAPIYFSGIFCGPKPTSQHRDVFSSFFSGYLKINTNLLEFLKQYESAVIARREVEKEEDFETNHKIRVLRSSMEIEKDAANVYTRSIFLKFQNELFEGLSHRHKKIEEKGTMSTYHLWKLGHEQAAYTVYFNCLDSSANCSCQLFESAGYLCKHILKIFVVEDVQNLLPQYILRRWTKDAKIGPLVTDEDEETQSIRNKAVSVRYNKLCQEALNVAAKGATSVEAYMVAINGLHNTLNEVETMIRCGTLRPIEQNKVDETGHSYKGSSRSCSDASNNALIQLI
ncbi:hypothetical protein MKX03_035902 [Papaver bracteatum]|nr:hypothetical protein MKX03_035902 [Papaver bracteatum]